MKTSILLSFIIVSLSARAQVTPIDVADNTLKVAAFGEEVFYYGFAEGDRVIFNFEELKGKELKEIEITELPGHSKFMDYKTKKIENKTLDITKTGIYKFRFANTGLGGRICKFKIQRIPSPESPKNFNCNVYWKTVYDTTYIPVEEQFLLKSDTAIVNVVDQVPKISSKNAVNGNSNTTIVDFDLPPGTISWSYYIGVGKEAYETATQKFISTAASMAIKIPGYGSMAALALHGVNYFSRIHGEDNVKYWYITDWNNVQLFKSGYSFLQYKQGDVVNDAYQMRKPLYGKVYLGFLNDNTFDPIEVTVKVTAATVKQEWETRNIQKMNITARQEAYLKN